MTTPPESYTSAELNALVETAGFDPGLTKSFRIENEGAYVQVIEPTGIRSIFIPRED